AQNGASRSGSRRRLISVASGSNGPPLAAAAANSVSSSSTEAIIAGVFIIVFSSEARRNVAEPRHLLAMARDDSVDLIATEDVAPLVRTAGAEELLALDRHLDEAVTPLHAAQAGEVRVADRALDAAAVAVEAGQPRDLAERLRRLLQQVLVAQHQDA